MAMADVYDALISRRVYTLAMPIEQAFEVIVEVRGSNFDPDIIYAFMAFDTFAAIAARFADRVAYPNFG
jgi:putative two-component system response regulator